MYSILCVCLGFGRGWGAGRKVYSFCQFKVVLRQRANITMKDMTFFKKVLLETEHSWVIINESRLFFLNECAFIHYFNKYIVSAYYVSGTVLGSGTRVVNKTLCPQGVERVCQCRNTHNRQVKHLLSHMVI